MAALVLTGAVAPTGPVAGREIPSDEELAHASRFRATMRFASDAETVLVSFSDTVKFPNLDYGIPLTPSEAAEVDRRARIGKEIDPAAIWAEANAPAYGGSWIDNSRGGLPVFMITDLSASVQQSIRDWLPAGFEVEFRDVRYSLRELNALQDEIEAARESLISEGIPLVSTSIQTPSNTVEVGLSSITRDYTDTLRARYGAGISIVHDPTTARADSCPRSDCAPVKGGIGLYSLQNNNSCTAGYIVRVITGTDYYAMLTAGHCFRYGGDSGQGDDWKHVLNSGPDLKVGDAELNTWYTGADADVGLIRLTSIPTDRNNFFGGTTTRSLVNYFVASAQQIGEPVCRTGWATLYQCGHIIDTAETRESELPPIGTRLIDHQWVVDFDASDGDSGGPYYYTSDGYGIHTHSRDVGEPGHPQSWYSPLDWARFEYENRWGITFNICLTDAC